MDAFSVFDRELLPPKKRKTQPVPVEPQGSMLPEAEDDVVFVSASPAIKQEPVEPKKEVISEDELEDVGVEKTPAEREGSADDVIFVLPSSGIKEEPVEPKIEVLSDDEEDGLENVEVEKTEETVWSLLKNWELDKLIPIFEKYKITLKVLQNMSEEDLRVMIPDEDLAIRILLRTNLRKWQNINGYGPFNFENMPSTSTTSANNTQHLERSGFAINMSASINSSSEDILSKDIESILKTSAKGKNVLNYSFLNSNERLSRNWRLCLCEAIADYCVQHKYILKNTHFNHLSNEIVRLFPAEDKDKYFTPRISKEGRTVSDPCGYLVDEYNYSCKKLRLVCQPLSNYKERKRSASPKREVDGYSQEQYEVDKLWLRTSRHPWYRPGGVVSKWKQSFHFRRKSFLENEQKEPLVEEWPILGHMLGYTLIESDFDQIYQNKSQVLFEKWDQFCTKLIPIIKTEIKESYGYQLFENYQRLSNKEMKNCICFQLINVLLPPTELIPLTMITAKGKKNRTSWKPSIRDACTSFFTLEFSEDDAKATAKIMARRYATLGLIQQPLIFGLGYKRESIKQFTVVYHNISYTVNSFVKAMDIVFKLYHVIDLHYNKESHLMWLFIQKYFFDIVKPCDLKSTELSDLISRLKYVD